MPNESMEVTVGRIDERTEHIAETLTLACEDMKTYGKRIGSLENFRSRAVGITVGLTSVSTLIGLIALIVKIAR